MPAIGLAAEAPADEPWAAGLTPEHGTVPAGVCAPPPAPLPAAAPAELAWLSPTPQGDHLLSVGGTSPRDLWAVGDRGRILHYTGSWRTVDSGVSDYLAGVWAADPRHVFVTGYNGRVLFFDGSAWHHQPTGVSNDFNGIWGASASDVFTVGDRGVIFHWDGTCWMRQESGTRNLFFGVWGSASADVWAVGGRGNVAHFDGLRWSPVDTGVGDLAFVSVWGSGADNVYIAGEGGTLLHRTGSGWGREDLGTETLLRWVWGSAASDVWVSGDEGFLAHFDGQSWQRVATGTDLAIRGGWSDPRRPSGLVLVGDDGLILSGSGKPGKPRLKPARQGVFADLFALDGNWAVGDEGVMMQRTRNGRWQPLKPVANGPRGPLSAVAALPDGRAVVAGSEGAWVGDGRHWRAVPVPEGRAVHALRAWGNRVLAAGDAGLVAAFTGDGWEILETGSHDNLYGIGGRSPAQLWVVGEDGAAWRLADGAWRAWPVPGGETLYAVSASGVAVGETGAIYRWLEGGQDGAEGAWHPVGGGGLSLMGVVDTADGHTWAVGDFGTILDLDNARPGALPRVVSATGQSLWGAGLDGNGRLTLVGDGGVMLGAGTPAMPAGVSPPR
ncbi:MAG: hypothetical protein OEW11_10205 [Nitrospirota bacterium]|nr:hypothetical protein [Nitrospirota bacterium]